MTQRRFERDLVLDRQVLAPLFNPDGKVTSRVPGLNVISKRSQKFRERDACIPLVEWLNGRHYFTTRRCRRGVNAFAMVSNPPIGGGSQQ